MQWFAFDDEIDQELEPRPVRAFPIPEVTISRPRIAPRNRFAIPPVDNHAKAGLVDSVRELP